MWWWRCMMNMSRFGRIFFSCPGALIFFPFFFGISILQYWKNSENCEVTNTWRVFIFSSKTWTSSILAFRTWTASVREDCDCIKVDIVSLELGDRHVKGCDIIRFLKLKKAVFPLSWSYLTSLISSSRALHCLLRLSNSSSFRRISSSGELRLPDLASFSSLVQVEPLWPRKSEKMEFQKF